MNFDGIEQKPVVSIVMPMKNAAPFVADCIDSIRAQSYTQFELIVVNDHSEDDSVQIVANYRSDRRIKLVDSRGQGIICALQTGYERTTGQLITRMDADDLMAESKLEKLAQLAAELGCGYVVTGYVTYFSDQNLGEGYLKYAQWLNRMIDESSHRNNLYKECVLPSPNWMMHRSDFELCGGFDSDLYPEDYDLCFRICRSGLRIAGVPHITHYWRDHPARVSRNSEHYADNSFTTLKIRYFVQMELSSTDVLVLWGAGTRGKAIARELQRQGIEFHWMTNNMHKVGHSIYDVVLEPLDNLSAYTHPKIIIAVAQRNAIHDIHKMIRKIPGGTEYWFC